MFADRRRLVDPRHWRFLVEVVRFLSRARRDLGGDARRARLARRLPRSARACHADVRERFVVPLAAALWSLAPERCGAFPAETYLRFLDQHGMLRADRGRCAWHTIVGGSRRYVDALVARLRDAPVRAPARDAGHARSRATPRGVTIVAGGREHRYDRVIVATHADTALALLAAPTDAERARARRVPLQRQPHGAAHRSRVPAAPPGRARVVELRRRSRHRARRGHVLDDAAAGPARRAVPRHAQPAPRARAACSTRSTFDAPAVRSRRARRAGASCARLGAAHRTYYAGALLRLRLSRGRHARRARRRRSRRRPPTERRDALGAVSAAR